MTQMLCLSCATEQASAVSGVRGPQPSQNIFATRPSPEKRSTMANLVMLRLGSRCTAPSRTGSSAVMKPSSQWNGRSSAACMVVAARHGRQREIRRASASRLMLTVCRAQPGQSIAGTGPV